MSRGHITVLYGVSPRGGTEMNSKGSLKNVVLYLGLMALFSLVMAYQMKSSLDTVRMERTGSELCFIMAMCFNPYSALAEQINDHSVFAFSERKR